MSSLPAVDPSPTALTPSQLGSTAKWSLDFALVGALSSFLAITAVTFDGFGWAYPLMSAAAGGLTGALLGPVLRRMLAGRLGTTPIYALLLMGLMAGFVWGAIVGVLGSFVFAIPGLAEAGLTFEMVALVSAVVAGVAGAVQFGWFWLPYTVRSARGRSTWPLVAISAVVAAGLGWLGLFSVISLGALLHM